MRNLALALIGLVIATTPAFAADLPKVACPMANEGQRTDDECPCQEGWAAKEQLQIFLQAHEAWLREDAAGVARANDLQNLCNGNLQGVDLRDTNLRKAALWGVDLRGAMLQEAHLEGANLNGSNLEGADLQDAYLEGAYFQQTNLKKAHLEDANLTRADLFLANVDGTYLAFADLTDALYAPSSPPPDAYVEGIKGISTIKILTGRHSGLVQLRELFKAAGLRDLEREATFAIEHNKALPQEYGRSIVEPLGLLKIILFEWTTAWGMEPERALVIALVLTLALTAVYVIPITSLPTHGSVKHGIFHVWPQGSLEVDSEEPKVSGQSKVRRLTASGLRAWGWALYFSIVSTFHFGWREINVGTWLSRVQPSESTLRPHGWVRVVSGFHSLISVYLVAIWALTYFGRPFQ